MKENREKQLIRNTAIVALGQICTKFITFFLLPLYTSLLSTEEYGIVDLFNTFVSLILPIMFLQISQSIFRFLIDVRDNEQEKKEYISTTMVLVLFQCLLFSIIYSVVSIFINNGYKYFLLTNVLATILSDVALQVSRGIGDNKTYSEGSLIAGAGTIILNVVFIASFKWGAYGMLSASLISNLLCFIFVYIKIRLFKYINHRNFSKDKLKKMLKYSIPLVPNQLSWWVINASDRVIISWILGVAVNGIYSAANKFSGICTTVFNIFNMTWAESASLHINDEDVSSFFSSIFNTAIAILCSICLCIISAMPFVFNIFIRGTEFLAAYEQIPILMIATIFNIVVALFGSIYIALKKTGEIAKTSTYSAIINIVVNILLIKYIGLYAASISTFVSYFVMALYRYFDVKKYIKIEINVKFICATFLLLLIVLYTYYNKSLFLCTISLIITIIHSITFNFDVIKTIISHGLKKIKR